MDSASGVPHAPVVESVTTAGVLTFLWPGLGHVYLGENQKAVPYLIVNCIGFILAWTLILLPISLVAWAVTLAMTLPGVKQETAKVNAEALVEYQHRWGLS